MYATIMAALDGSQDSLAGARLALDIARGLDGKIIAAHVYDTRIHNSRFREMEPGLPEKYRTGQALKKIRSEHDTLMMDGFQSLSHGYMENFLALAGREGVNVEEVLVENRNYVGLLQLLQERKFDLAVMGATGLGSQQDGLLGSTALRVLRKADCDVLIARRAETAGNGPVLIGVDGSDHALAALQKAVRLSTVLNRRLQVAAAYDASFHQAVFKTMARSMSAARQREVGLDRQESLHEDLIDKSLEVLYGNYLVQAAELAASQGCEPLTLLVRGKAYRALINHALQAETDIVVLGRFGHNRENISDIGSNAEAVVRLCKCNVLITAAPDEKMAPVPVEDGLLAWDREALGRLARIPARARDMARKGIEDYVRSTGATVVSCDLFQEAAEHFGMTASDGREKIDNDKST